MSVDGVDPPLLDRTVLSRGVPELAEAMAVLEAVIGNTGTSVTVVGADDAIVLTMGDGRMERTSRSVYVGRHLSDLVPDPSFLAMLRRVRAGGSGRHMVEFGGRTYDSTAVRLPVEVTGPGGVAVVATDVTDRVQESGRFQALVENLEEVTSILADDGSLRYISPGIEALSGYTPDEVMAMCGWDFVHPDDLPATEAAFQTVLERAGATVTQMFRGRHRDGTWRRVEQTMVNRRDDPAVGGIVSVARDVTDRLAATERSLALNRLHAVLGEVGNAMVRARGPGQLLNEVCRILVETGGFAGVAFITAPSHPDGIRVLTEFFGPAAEGAEAETRTAMMAAVLAGDAPTAARGDRPGGGIGDGVGPASDLLLLPVMRREDLPCVLALRRGPVTAAAAAEDEFGLLTGLVGNVAFALDALSIDRNRSEALELAMRRAQQQSIVSSLGVMALGTADTTHVIDAAVAALAPFGLRQVTLYECALGSDDLVVRAAVGDATPVHAGDVIGRHLVPMSSTVLASSEPVTVHDFSTDPRFDLSTSSFAAVGSAVSVPIRVAGAAVAVLTAHSLSANDFDAHDLHFYEAIANVISGVMERGRYQETIQHDAMHSPLTGLPNRGLLQDRLTHALERRSRHGSNPLAVLVLDIDGLKRINSTLGHEAGDRLLELVGQRLLDAVRPSDTVAHLGGDVFAILCEDLNEAAEAATVAERMLARIRSGFVVDGAAVNITASLGIAASADGATVEGLLRDADVAMYRAKNSGRDRYELVDDTLRGRLAYRAELEQGLAQALAMDEFRVVYQPKVSLLTDRVMGVEALLRWHRPTGVVPPLDFIPLAEESGLIVEIGAWVLGQVCRDARRWSNALPGGLPLTVAVNVSPRQFEAGLAASFGEIITTAGIDPGAVCLEVTESMVMQDADLAIALLRELKVLGLQISIDDFGTGLSSLAYLKRFPLDELKIDKSFVDGLGQDPEDTAIVAAVMGMAHALGLRVVAEGVETADQLTRLRTLGCDAAQGYHLGRPGSAADIDEILRAEAAAAVPGGASSVKRSARTQRVLVVDDAGDVRQLARASLAAVGYEVAEAASGEQALALTGSFRPDCVVLDIGLPGISGLEVCRILRERPETKQTTIVMASGDGAPAEKVLAFSLTADDYMVKPFSPRDLVSRVAGALRRRAEMPLQPLSGDVAVGVVAAAPPVIFPLPTTGEEPSAGQQDQYLHRFDLLRARFFDLSVDLMAVAGFDGYFKSVNPIWNDVLGFSEEEMLARPYIEFVHPEDRDATTSASLTLVNGVEIVSFENRYVAKDGSYRWLAWNAMPIVAEKLVYCTARDVTADKERRWALEGVEESLRVSEERSRLMVENTRDYAILTLDAAGLVTTWNVGGQTIKGYSGDEIIGAHFSRFYTDEDRAAGRPGHMLEAAVAVGRAEEEGWRVRKDGSRFFANVVITALLDDGGRLRGFGIVTRDITERHETAERLEAAHRELSQRTADLAAIGEATRAIAASSTATQRELCVAISQITGAAWVSLWEPGETALVATASVGLEVPTHDIAYDSTESGTATAFRTGEPIFVADAPSSALISQPFVRAAGAASAAFQPVHRDGSPCAVIAVAWSQPLVTLPSRMSEALSLLAAETAVIIERAALRKALADEARVDGLTGIANRRAWDEEAPRYLERARRSGSRLSIAVIDLDHFKQYNDRHGHQAGDRLLRAVALAWRGRLRGVDMVARNGGDEFGVLLADCDLEQALLVCESLRTPPVGQANCSVGVAEWSGAETLAAFVERADAALYAAKRSGRNRVRGAPRVGATRAATRSRPLHVA